MQKVKEEGKGKSRYRGEGRRCDEGIRANDDSVRECEVTEEGEGRRGEGG